MALGVTVELYASGTISGYRSDICIGIKNLLRIFGEKIEGLFGRIKNEFFYHRDWSGVSLEDFASLLDGYLVYYNEERPKESLGWVSPARRRAMYYEGAAV